MDGIQSGAAVAEPSDDEKESQGNHEDCEDLAPKTAGELVLDGSFLLTTGCAPGSSGAFFGGFSFFGCHMYIL